MSRYYLDWLKRLVLIDLTSFVNVFHVLPNLAFFCGTEKEVHDSRVSMHFYCMEKRCNESEWWLLLSVPRLLTYALCSTEHTEQVFGFIRLCIYSFLGELFHLPLKKSTITGTQLSVIWLSSIRWQRSPDGLSSWSLWMQMVRTRPRPLWRELSYSTQWWKWRQTQIQWRASQTTFSSSLMRWVPEQAVFESLCCELLSYGSSSKKGHKNILETHLLFKTALTNLLCHLAHITKPMHLIVQKSHKKLIFLWKVWWIAFILASGVVVVHLCISDR